MRNLGFAAICLALLPLNLISAHIGVLLWVWIALLDPLSLLYGPMASIPFNKIVAVITLSFGWFSKEAKDLYLDKALFLLVLFGLVVGISWYGGLVSDDMQDELAGKVVKEITLAFVIVAFTTTRAQIDRIVLVIAVSLGFLAVKEGLIFLLTAGGHKIEGTGGLGDNNGVAASMLITVPLLAYLARHSIVSIVRLGMYVVSGLSIVTAIATYSRGGVIGLAVLIVLMLKNSRRRLLTFMSIAVTGIIIYSVVPNTWVDRASSIQEAGTDTSFTSRLVAWEISLLIALDHPLFGGGLHAVQYASVWNQYKPSLHRVDFFGVADIEVPQRAAHSIYFEVLGDLGFVGLAVFLAIVVVSWRNCQRVYNLCKDDPARRWAAELARMIQVSLAVYLVTGAALSIAYYELFFILVALTSRCRRTIELQVAAERGEQIRLRARTTLFQPEMTRPQI